MERLAQAEAASASSESASESDASNKKFFFGSPAFLTVSAQLHLECLARLLDQAFFMTYVGFRCHQVCQFYCLINYFCAGIQCISESVHIRSDVSCREFTYASSPVRISDGRSGIVVYSVAR